VRALFLSIFLALLSSGDSGSWWSVQASGRDTNLRGVSVAYNAPTTSYFVWASGSNGVILRSVNDGKTWKQIAVQGGSGLDFRDIEAFDADLAYVMSSGDGDKSRVYKTTDGGTTWTLQYSDKRPGFFLDSLACDSKTHCVALSDPVDGKFLVLSTTDGEHWTELPRDNMPAALPKEGAFAASGTAVALCDGVIFFGTGGPKARIFHSDDQGKSWIVAETPVASGDDSSGIFSIACADFGDTIVAVGGNYRQPANADRVAIYSRDSGKTWGLSARQPGGYRSAVGEFFDANFAAVGPNGTDISDDRGKHWKRSDPLNLNAVSFNGSDGWAVGPNGTIARFKTHIFYQIKNPRPADTPFSAGTR
jgi:photosystem II stability/assembly factor-like uncharacterized protein